MIVALARTKIIGAEFQKENWNCSLVHSVYKLLLEEKNEMVDLSERGWNKI